MSGSVPTYLPFSVVTGCVVTITAVVYGVHRALKRSDGRSTERTRTVLAAALWLTGWFVLGVGDVAVYPRTVLRWNLLGIADLVVAVSTGFLTAPSPFQMFAFDRPNQLITMFPLVLIPTFLVPLAILLHFVSLIQLRRATLQGRATVRAGGGAVI
jgi:cytochrome bd-type quinol oxidase subunit 2